MKEEDRLRLQGAARERNATLWCDLDWAGLLAPVIALEHLYNELREPLIEDQIIVSDELWRVKEVTRDRTADLDLLGIIQEKDIAALKVALGYEKLAITRAVAEYKLAVRRYESKVRDLLMAAREFAAQVEIENLGVDAERLQLDIDKEVLQQDKMTVAIQEEAVNQKMVEADIAKYQVEVAKAQVRAAMAQVGAAETEVQVVESNVQVALTQIEAVELAARVVTILAEIASRGVAAVRLAAETQELNDRMQVVSIKEAAELALQDERLAIQLILKAGIEAIGATIPSLTAAQIAGEQLMVTEAESAEKVLEHKQATVENTLNEEESLNKTLVAARIAVQNAKRASAVASENARTAAHILVNAAHQWAVKNMSRLEATQVTETLRISKG